jgi:predicted transcriptional regulator
MNTDTDKQFADLLAAIMECLEKTQEADGGGEGNYLIGMNALRDAYKLAGEMKQNKTYHRYARVAIRASAHRQKMSDEMKRARGYVACEKCGCLFADKGKVSRHQKTTEKCRHILHEKEVAKITNRIIRQDRVMGKNANRPPNYSCITKTHPFYSTFIHSMLLFMEAHVEEEMPELVCLSIQLYEQEQEQIALADAVADYDLEYDPPSPTPSWIMEQNMLQDEEEHGGIHTPSNFGCSPTGSPSWSPEPCNMVFADHVFANGISMETSMMIRQALADANEKEEYETQLFAEYDSD